MRRIEIKLKIDKVFDAMNQNLREYTSECIQNINDLNLQQKNGHACNSLNSAPNNIIEKLQICFATIELAD